MRQTVSSFSSLLSLSYTFKTIVYFHIQKTLCVYVWLAARKGRYPWTMCACVGVAIDWSVVIYKNHSIICPLTNTHTSPQTILLYIPLRICCFPKFISPAQHNSLCLFAERENESGISKRICLYLLYLRDF